MMRTARCRHRSIPIVLPPLGTRKNVSRCSGSRGQTRRYQTLRDPLRRATYMLSLRGVHADAENNTAMEPTFLMQQMEWCENIEDAADAKNLGVLEALLNGLRDQERIRFEKLAALIDSHADHAASKAVRQLMFIERVASEIGVQIEKLD